MGLFDKILGRKKDNRGLENALKSHGATMIKYLEELQKYNTAKGSEKDESAQRLLELKQELAAHKETVHSLAAEVKGMRAEQAKAAEQAMERNEQQLGAVRTNQDAIIAFLGNLKQQAAGGKEGVVAEAQKETAGAQKEAAGKEEEAAEVKKEQAEEVAEAEITTEEAEEKGAKASTEVAKEEQKTEEEKQKEDKAVAKAAEKTEEEKQEEAKTGTEAVKEEKKEKKKFREKLSDVLKADVGDLTGYNKLKEKAKGAWRWGGEKTDAYTPTLKKLIRGTGRAAVGTGAAGVAGAAGAVKPSSFADLIIVLGWVIHALQLAAGMRFSARMYIFFLVLIMGVFLAGDTSIRKWVDFIIIMFAAFFDLAFYGIKSWLAGLAWMPLWVPDIFVKQFWPVWVYAGIIMALRPGAVTKKSKLTMLSIVMVLFFWMWYSLGATGALEAAESTFGFEPGEGILTAERSKAAQMWEQFTSGERDEIYADAKAQASFLCSQIGRITPRCKKEIEEIAKEISQRKIAEGEASKGLALEKYLDQKEKIIAKVEYRESGPGYAKGRFALQKGEKVDEQLKLYPMGILKPMGKPGYKEVNASSWSIGGETNTKGESVPPDDVNKITSETPLLFTVKLGGIKIGDYESYMRIGVKIEVTTTSTTFPLVVGEQSNVIRLASSPPDEFAYTTRGEYYKALFSYYKSTELGSFLDKAYPKGMIKAKPQPRFARIYLDREIGGAEPIVKVKEKDTVVRLRVKPFREKEDTQFSRINGEIVKVRKIKLEFPEKIFVPKEDECDFRNEGGEWVVPLKKIESTLGDLKEINKGFESTMAGFNCVLEIRRKEFLDDAKDIGVTMTYKIKATMTYDYLVKSKPFRVPKPVKT